MDKKNIYQSIVFFIIGIGLLWFVFKDIDLELIKSEFNRLKWFWVGVSIALNLLSQLVRAYRWKTLFKPLNYSPKTHNLFFAILILAFTNQIIPRGGEIARLGIIKKYENIPLSKLLGIALVERLTDFILLILIFVTLLIWQFSVIQEIIALPQVNLHDFSFKKTILITGISLASIFILYFIIRKFDLLKKFKSKIKQLKKDLHEGFTSIYHIKNKALYVTQSVLIYGIWLLMLYVLFLAYPPTEHLDFKSAALTFGLATLAFLLPIQAGMGAWHFVVVQCLVIFGIQADVGKVFSLIAHSATNHIYLITGTIAFALLPILNSKRVQTKNLIHRTK